MKALSPTSLQGSMAWMVNNPVVANLLMIFLLVGGLIMAFQIKQEVFPEFELDIVTISVPYPGASPEEIERGIILAIEEEVRGVDGVKRVTSVSAEGSGTVKVELLTGFDRAKGLQDIKNVVDRITSFPEDAERPIVSLVSNRRAVISLIIAGEMEEHALRQLAEKARDELLGLPNITMVEVSGTRPPEISIEVPQEKLRSLRLTLDEIAQQVGRAAVEIPGGGVKTKAGEVLLRTDERRDFGSEFENIAVISRRDGSRVLLSDIAQVRDTFRDVDLEAYFNGKPAVQLVVYRIGDQTPIQVSDEVRSYAKGLQERLPPGVEVATLNDRSETFRDRINLLLRNGATGLALVLVVLGLFLELRLAFWVTMGIPISFFGSFLLMPAADISLNMVSLFAFIITLGIVVDDAIVVGENVYDYRQKGLSFVDSAILGSRDVKVPVVFSVLTNIAAFIPMFFIPGTMGKFFWVIPAIVVCVFTVSLIESLFVLPAHLAHSRPSKEGRLTRTIQRAQMRFASALELFVANFYTPVVRKATTFRYLTLAVGLAMLILSFGVIKGGWVNFTFMPKVDGDVVSVKAVLPYGAPVADTKLVANRLYGDALQLLNRWGGASASRGIFTLIGATSPDGGAGPSEGGGDGSHIAAVTAYLVPSDKRSFTAVEFANAWRELSGEIPGLESMTFTYSVGPGAGAEINIEASHPELTVLYQGAAELADELRHYAGVKDVDDGFSEGKPQLNLKVSPLARSLGLTAAELARQVRAAFYGARAFRQQRGRDEVWVMVRLPEQERRSEHNINDFLALTPSGGEIPLNEAAKIERGRAYTKIQRADGRRVVEITADIVEGKANAGKVLAEIRREILPKLEAKYPSLRFGFEGKQRDQRESISALLIGFSIALLGIFTMLAIPFGSYIQPVIVMTAIPFGFVGAVIGHLIMGYDLSLVSMMGLIALAGVVVNDSLVLVFHANELKADGLSAFEAITTAGARRFRPIMLTSLTTFFGLAPMIFETSVQARFLIPMALSLGFGVMFSTLITLFLVPALYVIVEDVGAKLAHAPLNAG